MIALDKAEATAGLGHVVRMLCAAVVPLTLAAAGIAAFFTAHAFGRLSWYAMRWTPSAPAPAT